MNFGGISGMFRNTQQVTTAPSQQPQQQAPTPTGKPGSTMDPNAGNAQGGAPAQPAAPNSPLDPFKDMWKNAPNDGKGPPADPFSSPLFQTDPAKIREAASQIDFASQVPQELMQKAMSGSDPQAFVQVMNTMVQNALATSLQLATATTETAGQRIGERFNNAMPGRFKDFQINSQKPVNPALTHPAAAPILQSVRAQVKSQNPDMSAEQINQIAEDYLSNFSQTMQSSDPNAPKPAASGNGEQPDFNWAEWASTTSTSR